MLAPRNDTLFHLDNFAAKSLDSVFLFLKGLKQFDYDEKIRGNPFQLASLLLLFQDQHRPAHGRYLEPGAGGVKLGTSSGVARDG